MALTLSRKSAKKPLAPRINRELQARMKLAGVDAGDVSRKLRISYARCTEIISGARNHPANFTRIQSFVFSLPIH